MRKWGLKKLIKEYFLLKAIFCTRSKQFRQPFQKLWLKIRSFFYGNWNKLSEKGFVRWTKTFFKIFQCTLWLWTGQPCWKVFAQISEWVERIRKNSTKRLTFFPQIFHLVYCKHAIECKRKEILLEHLRKCEKMHFKIINADGIALKTFLETFFFHVVKFCEKEFFYFRKLKVLKNCLFAKTYAPLFLKIIFNRTWWLKKNSGGWLFFLFLHPCLNALQKS